MDQAMPTGKMESDRWNEKLGPGLVMLIGLLFLLNSNGTLPDDALAVLWPFALILLGLHKMYRRPCAHCPQC